MRIFIKTAKPISEIRPSQVEQLEKQNKEDEVDLQQLAVLKKEYEIHVEALRKVAAYCGGDLNTDYHVKELKTLLTKELMNKL